MSAALLCATLLALLALPKPAWPARQLPADAAFGQVTRFQYPLVTIGKHVFRMAPGGKIYNQQNLIIMPSAMPGTAAVLFKLDTAGHLSGLWLLTPQEAARYKRPTTKPVTPPAGDREKRDDPTRLGRD